MQHQVCEIAWDNFVTLGSNVNLASSTYVPWILMVFDMNNVGMSIIWHLKFPENFHGTLMKNEAADINNSALLSVLSDQHKCN
eukprot:203803-Ditylum_brightwellii.AAC.1